MKVSKGQSQPKIAAAAFLILYMVLGSPFLYQVLIATHMTQTGKVSTRTRLLFGISHEVDPRQAPCRDTIVDECHFAPPKKPWNESIPLQIRTNVVDSKWCEMDFATVHISLCCGWP